jgi:hypothetical protein
MPTWRHAWLAPLLPSTPRSFAEVVAERWTPLVGEPRRNENGNDELTMRIDFDVYTRVLEAFFLCEPVEISHQCTSAKG